MKSIMRSSQRKQRARFQKTKILLWVLYGAVLFGSTPGAEAQYRACVPQFSGVPFTYSPPGVTTFMLANPPNTNGFNGDIDNDTGWTGAFRYVLWNGTTNADGAVQMIQDKSKKLIYVSIQIKNDPTFDLYDAIILGFDRDGSNADLQRLIIKPLVGLGKGNVDPNGVLPNAIEYDTGYTPGGGGPGTGTWATANTDPTWVTARARSAGVAPALSWNVEILIDNSNPLNGPQLPTGSDFGMYINLVRVDSTLGVGNETATEFTWPAATPLALPLNGAPALLEGDSLPAKASWGVVTLANTTSCVGVNFAPGDAITNNFPGIIALNKPNQFSVKLVNSGTANAQNVSALFQIANYGLPAPEDWTRPGEAASNTIGSDPVTAPLITGMGGNVTLSTGTWQPGNNIMKDTGGMTEHDYYQAHPDTCIRVQLNSTNPDTVFLSRASWNNFWVRNASQFDGDATVGTNGYKLGEEQGQHQFNLTVIRNESKHCTGVGTPNQRTTSQLDYVVEGCRLTGGFLQLGKSKVAICDSVGAFGYGLHHEGDVAQWADNFSGEGLKKLGEGATYRLSVPRGKNAVLHTRILPKEAPHHKPCGQDGNRTFGAAVFFGLSLLGIMVYQPGRKNTGDVTSNL